MHTHRFQIVSKRLPRPIWAAGWSVQLCKAVAWCSSRRPNEKRRRRNCLANQVGTRLTYCPALFMFILTWWLAFRLASSIIVHNAWAHTHTNTRSHTQPSYLWSLWREQWANNPGPTRFPMWIKKADGPAIGYLRPFYYRVPLYPHTRWSHDPSMRTRMSNSKDFEQLAAIQPGSLV